MRNPITPQNTPQNTPSITVASELERMRANSSREPQPMGLIVHDHVEPRSNCLSCEHNQALNAHRYAERCQLQAFHDEERRHLVTARLNGILSALAELKRQIALLEAETLLIADVLA